MKFLTAVTLLVLISMTTTLQCYLGQEVDGQIYEMNLTTCPEDTYSCFHASFNMEVLDQSAQFRAWGCGHCDTVEEMYGDFITDAEMSCMECMTDNCNEVSGAGHLAISSLLLVLPVLLY